MPPPIATTASHSPNTLSFAQFRPPARTGLGLLLVIVSDVGLHRIVFDRDQDDTIERLAEHGRTRLVRSPAATAAVREELAEYFRGRRRVFHVPLDLSAVHGFPRRALQALHARVPFGKTVSYGGLAVLAKRPGAARAVGRAVGGNPVPVVVPCHRVIAADGSLGGFGAGLDTKRALLEIEGIRGLRGGWAPGGRT